MPENEKAHINPSGFREYDARWIYPKDINKEGIKNVGQGLGSQIISKTKKSPRVIVGHDYRSYSEEVKKKLIEGLMDAGCNVEDIGLALSPTAYYAQFNLNADAVAMVTASHNETSELEDLPNEHGDDFHTTYKGEISKSGTAILPSKRIRRIPEKTNFNIKATDEKDGDESKKQIEPETSSTEKKIEE